MKTKRQFQQAGFTALEILISMSIFVSVIGMALATYMFGLRTMYKDTQRLATNASLRSFMAQISKETLDASTFYLFRYYTALDGSVVTKTDAATLLVDQDYAGTENDKYVAHGDCLVLITKTVDSSPVKIRQLRIYYRVTTNTSSVNTEAPLRYYETSDWGEDKPGANPGDALVYENTHLLKNIDAELSAINLSANPSLAGSRLINARSKGRAVVAPVPSGYSAGDRFPIFSTDSPTQVKTNGFIAINVEFINGTTVNNLLSSSSFNYTISPKR